MNKTLRLLSLLAVLQLTARYASAQSGNITFADENVKALCVANWDTDGDGELSYNEAAAVTNLGEVFSYNSSITNFDELQYFTGLTNIGVEAFRFCSALTSVTIPEGVTSIGDNAFSSCSALTSVTIPSSVTSIGSYTFYGCSGLTSVTIPSSVTSFGDYAFSFCTGLTSITIPNSVRHIGSCAFYGCRSLTTVECYGQSSGIVDNESDAVLCSDAFSQCSELTTVAIPASVKSIEEGAFYGCGKLMEITIPQSVVSMDGNPFSNCPALQAVHVEEGSNSLLSDDGVVYTKDKKRIICYPAGKSGTSYNIASTVETIGKGAFKSCVSLVSVTIPNSVTSIGDGAFYGCSSVTDFTIPNSVTYIGVYAFSKTGISTLNIPKSVVVIGDSDYPYNPASECQLESVNVEEGNPSFISVDGILFNKDLTAIICYPPRKMNKSYAIPNTVTCIGHYAFSGCTNLSTVSIGSNVEFIGSAAFIWCSGLRDIYCNVKYDEADPFRLGFGFNTNVFLLSSDWYNPIVPTLHVPSGCKQYYEQFGLWSSMNIVEMDGTIIQFADENVKAICVANWDTDGDGELSYDEAAAVTELGEVFKNNSEITSFDELQYFTGLMTISYSAFKGCKRLTSVTIPEGVTSIGSEAFGDCSSLSNVTIPSSVINISDHAFFRCTSLTSVTIPDGVTSIGDRGFAYCSALTSVNLPEGLMCIDRYAFQYCTALTSVTIPESVTSIGEDAFSGCTGLTSIIIPASVTSIGDAAFSGCSSLSSIAVDGGNKFYDSRNDCNAIIKTESNTLITGCQNTVIPNSVTSISDDAFYGCSNLTSVTIPQSVTSIGSQAFYGCIGLTSITLPSTVTSIDYRAFYNCTSLTEVVSLIEEPFEISSDVFSNWNNETSEAFFTSATLYVPVGTKEKYEAAAGWKNFNPIVEKGSSNNIVFADQTVKTICVANWDTDGDGELSYDEAAAVTDLGEVFLGWLHIGNRDITSFDELQFFTGLTSIGDLAFKGCTNLTSVTIPEGVTSIGEYAFGGCYGLTSVTIPEGVTSIGEYAFGGCYGLTSVTIPSSVTSIGSSAFSGCSSLTGVTIPLNVASIGENAFESCSGLTSITVEEGNEVYDSRNDCNAIIETASNTLIAGCQNTVIPESVTSIGNGAFHGCSGLTSVTIPEGVTSIGNSAFKYCSGLMSISIPESVMSIGEYGFRECTGLTEVTIPGSVSAIGNYAFDLCTGLTSVTILEGVESIGELAFYGCSSLTNVTIPESVTSIDEAAFSDCISLTSITIPESVTIISKDVFSRCSGLTNVTIPSGVTTIEYRAFEDCTSLTSVTIPESVTSIGKSVFYGCTSLTSVTSLIEEPFEITSDVFENWNDETEQYDFTTATLYVPAGTKEKYLATPAWNQFLNIVEMGLEPVEQGETVDFGTDLDADTDLDGNVVGDIYYSISGGNGAYNAAEGCIVVTTPTADNTMEGMTGTDIFGEDFNDHFTGIVFKVAPGKGTIKIEAETTGSMVLKVKIGDNEPITMELEGKLKVSFPYNVSEDTYVYIYAGTNAAQANSARAASADGALKIYGIEVESVVDGIDTVQTDDGQDAPVYNLNGQRLNTPARGVYIKGGKKVLVK